MKSLAKLLVTAGFMLSVGPAIGAPADTAPLPPVMTDPQIAQIVLVANNAEIQAARSARARARSKPVLDFAQLMITDHGALRLQSVRLFRRLNIIPLDSDTSRELQRSVAEQLQALRRMRSVDFDRGYISQQIKAHQDVLDLFHRVLLPNAKAPDIKALLEKTQPVIERHLKLAEEILRGMAE